MNETDAPIYDILNGFGIETNERYEKCIYEESFSPKFDSFSKQLTNEDKTKELVIKYRERYKIVEIEIVPIPNDKLFYKEIQLSTFFYSF